MSALHQTKDHGPSKVGIDNCNCESAANVRFPDYADFLMHRLVAYIANCIGALMSGKWLPPLPMYWDRLEKCDWHMWKEEESVLASAFHDQIVKQLRLRDVAAFSPEHEALYWDFVMYGEGASKPLRPLWLG